MPDLLYRRELEQMGGADLVACGLRVEELTGDELSVAQRVRGEHPKLSLPDAYAYSLASSVEPAGAKPTIKRTGRDG